MGNKPLSPVVIVAVIVAAVLLFGIIGWKLRQRRPDRPHGEDLSKPAPLTAGAMLGRRQPR